MTYSVIYVWHIQLYMCDIFSYICVTYSVIYVWHIQLYMCDTFIWVIHESGQNYKLYYTCQRVMSHTNESCHIWMSHVTYEWVISHIYTPTYNSNPRLVIANETHTQCLYKGRLAHTYVRHIIKVWHIHMSYTRVRSKL